MIDKLSKKMEKCVCSDLSFNFIFGYQISISLFQANFYENIIFIPKLYIISLSLSLSYSVHFSHQDTLLIF